MIIGKQGLFRLFLLAFFFWFCIFFDKAFSDTLGIDIKSQTEELSRIKKELEEKRSSVKKLDQKEESVYEELLNLEGRLDLAQRLKRRLAAEEKNLEHELEREELSLQNTDAALNFYVECSHRRLREIYKHRRLGSYAIIFQSSSPADLVNRLNFTQMILKEDQDLLLETKNLKAETEGKKRNLEKTIGELSALRKTKVAEESEQKKELKEKGMLLKKIKSEKKLYRGAMEELEKNASGIENILAQISQEKQKTPSIIETKEEGLFGISKGKLPWPVPGKVIAPFGEQRNSQFQTKTKNPGIEIEVEPGQEVLAVAEGKVVYSSPLRGYGNVVILEHAGGYYTIYARLSEILISPGEDVERLQRIGIVGENGFFPNPGLHFEIRKGKQPQDPLEWLR